MPYDHLPRKQMGLFPNSRPRRSESFLAQLGLRGWAQAGCSHTATWWSLPRAAQGHSSPPRLAPAHLGLFQARRQTQWWSLPRALLAAACLTGHKTWPGRDASSPSLLHLLLHPLLGIVVQELWEEFGD